MTPPAGVDPARRRELAPVALAWLRRTGGRVGPDGRALGRVVGYFVVTRLALFIVAACAIRLLPAPNQVRIEAYLGRNPSLTTWVRWDAWWYVSVIERGYWFDPEGQSNVAFFPVFPLLMRLVMTVVDNAVVAGLLLANVAALAGVLAFWGWVRDAANAETADRATRWLLVYPFSFFFHTIYAESTFFLFATLALWAAGRRRWGWAGLCGLVAAGTRPWGIGLSVACAWGLWSDRRRGQPLRVAPVAAILLPAVGLGAYLAYLWLAFGDPLAFWHAHAVGWKVRPDWSASGYWRGLYRAVTTLPRVESYVQLLATLRLPLAALAIALSVAAYRRLSPMAGLYSGLVVGAAILLASDSFGRELLAAPPAFAAAGLAAGDGALPESLRLLSFCLLMIFLFALATGHFVS